MEYIPEKKNKSIFKTYLIYFVSLVVFALIKSIPSDVFAGLKDVVGLEAANNIIEIGFTLLIQVGCLFLLPLTLYCILLRQKPKQVFRTCNYYKMNFKLVLYSVLLGICLYFLTIIMSRFFNGILFLFGYSGGSSGSSEFPLSSYLIQIVTVAILPALCEEFIHRGLLLQGTKHESFGKAIIISSVLFGLIHLSIVQVFYAIILGIIMGYVAVITKNIWPAVIVHFMNNFLSITSSYFLSFENGYSVFMNNLSDKLTNINFIVIVLVIILGMILLFGAIYLLLNRLYFNSIVKKVENAILKAYDNSGLAKSDQPIYLDSTNVKYLVENTTTLNLDFNTLKNPFMMMMPKQNERYKTTFRDKIFLRSSLFLGIMITIFTLVWGFM